MASKTCYLLISHIQSVSNFCDVTKSHGAVHVLTDLLNGSVFPVTAFADRLILQGGYLIYGCIMGREPRHGYTSLCSAARDEELRWVQVILGEIRSSFVMMGVFAVASGKPCFYFSCFFHFPQVRKVAIP